MPILKANEALPERPVIILIYGEPGIGKTSLFNTAPRPLLIDFDRGKDRAIFRQDTLVVNSWDDIETEEKAGTFKEYATVGIDTAKAALDDFLMSYVVKKDYKNAKNKLAAYGAIGDDFKIFVSNRRAENADIIIICHSKDDKDGEVTKKIPDVTGGSYQLLLRIADQVGYMSMVNNKRTIQFEPTDKSIGKNVARLPLIEIPNEADPTAKTFMAQIISDVKKAITAQSEAQKEALEQTESVRKAFKMCLATEDLELLLGTMKGLPKALELALMPEYETTAIGILNKFTKVEELNNFIKFYSKPPLKITKGGAINVAVTELAAKHEWKFDAGLKCFVAPPPPEPAKEEPKPEVKTDELKETIPGPSLTDEEPAVPAETLFS